MKKFKKFGIILGALLVMVLPLLGGMGAHAVPLIGESCTPDPEPNLLGLKPWYSGLMEGKYVKEDGGEIKCKAQLKCVQDQPSESCMALSSFIWTAASNVAIDLAVVAAFGAIGFMIYGGYLYMMSSGEASKVYTGKKTITNSIIGLSIAMLARVIFVTIKTVLLSSSYTTTEHNLIDVADPGLVATETIQWIVGVAGVICLIFIVLGGIGYMTSSGDVSKVKKAKDTLIYALIGLVLVGFAQFITALVASTIRNAQEEETTSSLIKEANEEQIS